MVKCKKCGYENDLDSTFCEKCGAKVTASFRSRPQGMPIKKEVMANSTKILIFLAVILVGGLVIAAGAMIPTFFHPLQNNTFSESGISFQYPGNWSNNATITWISDSNLQNETAGKLGNGNVTLGVLYEPVSPDDIQSLGTITINSWGNNGANGSVISNTVSQVGANSVDEIIYTEKDPVSNVMYENYYILLGGSGNHVYAMRFRAPQTDFANYYSQFQSIVSSVIISDQSTTTQPQPANSSTTTTPSGIDNNAPGIINPDEANQVLIDTGVPAGYGFSTVLNGDVYNINVYDTNGNYLGAATINAQNGQIISDDINLGG
jgi:hypothetical protein